MSLHLSAQVPLRGVDATVEVSAGTTVALLGPNGSGKSTMLDVAAGLLRTSSSQVLAGSPAVTWQDARTWVPTHRRRVSLLHQDPSLFGWMTAVGNVAYAARSTGANRADAHASALAWLSRVGASQVATVRAAHLSGGQAQRVALARALAREPDVMLLDEPLSALDVDVAASVRPMLAEVLAPVTTVVATHHLLDCVVLADELVVLHEGRVAESGPRAQVLSQPAHPFSARMAGRGHIAATASSVGAVLEDGAVAACAGLEGLATGSAVVLAPRAHHVTVGAPDRFDVAARVTHVEAHDHLVRVHLSVAGGHLVAELDLLAPQAQVAVPGAAASVRIDPGVVAYPVA